MKLAPAPAQYDPRQQNAAQQTIERADGQNYKRGQDVELQPDQRLILVDTVTGDRCQITVASGALVVTPL